MTFLAAASQRPWGDVCHIKDRWGQLFQVCFFGLLLSETSIQDKQVEGERGSTWERKQPLAPLEKRSVGSFPSTSVLWKLSMPSFSCHSTVAFRGWVHPPPLPSLFWIRSKMLEARLQVPNQPRQQHPALSNNNQILPRCNFYAKKWQSQSVAWILSWILYRIKKIDRKVIVDRSWIRVREWQLND